MKLFFVLASVTLMSQSVNALNINIGSGGTRQVANPISNPRVNVYIPPPPIRQTTIGPTDPAIVRSQGAVTSAAIRKSIVVPNNRIVQPYLNIKGYSGGARTPSQTSRTAVQRALMSGVQRAKLAGKSGFKLAAATTGSNAPAIKIIPIGAGMAVGEGNYKMELQYQASKLGSTRFNQLYFGK